MGSRKIVIKQSVADNIAAIAFYIESKGMLAAAERFTDEVYNFIISLSNPLRSYAGCREPTRASMGYKCANFKRKYTVVFLESDAEILVCEFISSKSLKW